MSVNNFEQVNQEISQELAELNTDDLSNVVGGCNHNNQPHLKPHPTTHSKPPTIAPLFKHKLGIG